MSGVSTLRPNRLGFDPGDPLDEARAIPLSKGYQAIVDAEDYGWLSEWKWWAVVSPRGAVYAVRQIGRRNVYMHRLITDAPAHLQVDHRSGDTLDNRRANLRRCTGAENMANTCKCSTPTTSLYKGVYLHSRKKSWVARIQVDRRDIYLGLFDSQEDAAAAYNVAASRFFGEFARLNFILAETAGEGV